MTENLPGDVEIILNYHDTKVAETVEFASDTLDEILFEFEDINLDTVQAIKVVSCCSNYYDVV